MSAENPYGQPETPAPPAPANAAVSPYGAPASPPPAYAAPPQAYAPPAYAMPPAPTRPNNPLAITSMVCALAAPAVALLGTVLIWVPVIGLIIMFFAPVGALLGVVLGHISMRQIARSGESGRGLALTGIIVGWVCIGFALLSLLILGLIAGSLFAIFGAVVSGSSAGALPPF